MQFSEYVRWLDSIPDNHLIHDVAPPPRLASPARRKRRRSDSDHSDDRPYHKKHDYYLHSPPISKFPSESRYQRAAMPLGASATKTPKRARRPGPGDQNNDTPRPPGYGGRPASIGTPSNHSATSRSTASRSTPTSHASSARKRKREVEDADIEPITIAPFSTALSSKLLPERLQHIYGELTLAERGKKPCISQSRKAVIDAANMPGTSSIVDTDYFEHKLPLSSMQDMESPDAQQVLEICEMAALYDEEDYDEAAWCMAVFYPILRLAVPRGGLVDVIPCTSASIEREYLRQDESGVKQTGNKVDFCLAINPHWPSGRHVRTPASEAVRSLGKLLGGGGGGGGGGSINHTSYRPLAKMPIGACIEAKRSAGSVEDAKLQLAKWNFSQWKLLETVVDFRRRNADGIRCVSNPTTTVRRRPSDEACPETAVEEASSSDLACSVATSMPQFLPAIYIVGQEWKFAASTRSGSETRVWTDCPIGNTNTVAGIYSLIWCIRRIVHHIIDDYWPWFRRVVLELRDGG